MGPPPGQACPPVWLFWDGAQSPAGARSRLAPSLSKTSDLLPQAGPWWTQTGPLAQKREGLMPKLQTGIQRQAWGLVGSLQNLPGLAFSSVFYNPLSCPHAFNTPHSLQWATLCHPSQTNIPFPILKRSSLLLQVFTMPSVLMALCRVNKISSLEQSLILCSKKGPAPGKTARVKKYPYS